MPQDAKSLPEYLEHEVQHYAHMLSEQGPMNITFVHNNTLLGLQHLHFEAAIKEAHRVLGARGYEPISNFRAYYRRGRITDKDVDRTLEERAGLDLDQEVVRLGERVIQRREVLRAALLSGAEAMEVPALAYAIETRGAIDHIHSDVPETARTTLLKQAAERLNEDLSRIGPHDLLSDWVGRLLGLPLQARLLQAAMHAEQTVAGIDQDVSAILDRLGIGPSIHTAYLEQLDRLIATRLPDAGAAQRLAALMEEQRLLEGLCRRHWGIGASLSQLADHFGAHLEKYACLSLWQACLQQLDLTDPFSPTDSQTLQAHDRRLDEAESEASLQQSGRFPAQLSRVSKSRLTALLDEVERRGLDPVTDGDSSISMDALREQLANGALDKPALDALINQLDTAKVHDFETLRAILQLAAPHHSRSKLLAADISKDLTALTSGRTHADWLAQLTGVDLVDTVNTYMIRICSAFIDEGLSAWRMPDRNAGFFAAWRQLAETDVGFRLDRLAGWREELAQLPQAPTDALIVLLEKLGVAPEHWGEYLGRMLAQLKGWAGMAYWYELHPQHYKQAVQPIDTLQYLAVRLFYEWLLVRQTCRDHWALDGHSDDLRRYFENHPNEYLVRRELCANCLPDGLAENARRVLGSNDSRRYSAQLEQIADAVWFHRMRAEPVKRVADQGWRLFRIAQLLGMTGADIEALSSDDVLALLGTLDGFPDEDKAPIWLRAYERHYRDEVLNAIAQNHGRGRWARGRNRRPRSQLVLCIDEREENLHRHYAELDPDHETLGAAGFFGVAMSYSALDDHHPFPMCPAVATPAHRVVEIPRLEALHAEYPVHKRRFKWKEVFEGTYWESKRNLISSFFLIELIGFLMALPLIGRVFAPHAYGSAAATIGKAIVPPVRTRLTHLRLADEEIQSLSLPDDELPLGFSVDEAADRIEAQLRNWGLTYQFARIVVTCSHRSISVNNPHENAHDCGACSGKAGGPNARLFAALANDPQVRQVLRERGIEIPDDTWFVGGEHNTASDEILCYDTEDIPDSLLADWQLVSADLEEMRKRAARERCRRFGSAPKDVSIEASLKHVESRSRDLSQVRPEWGHCTNAFAVVGRRCVTQGLFFDRRGFIIAYDPTQDPDGKILERILLAVGPVGAGINLEYYFSTVDPDSYGCSTKVPHNVTGMIGVMAGAHSDLQTGLPRQMTEVHEAMRLQLIVDAPMAILGEIYGRQPGIQQLLDNEWVLLTAHDPETGELHQFVPGEGFRKWDEPLVPLPEVSESYEWFKGKHECFLPPARIAEPTVRWTEKTRSH